MPTPSRSMYSQLVLAALGDPALGSSSSAAEAAAEVFRCRRRLDRAGWREPDRQSVDAVLADEVAYDVALIRYARAVGVTCDPRDFGWPHQGRRAAEDLLATGGIHLYDGS